MNFPKEFDESVRKENEIKALEKERKELTERFIKIDMRLSELKK